MAEQRAAVGGSHNQPHDSTTNRPLASALGRSPAAESVRAPARAHNPAAYATDEASEQHRMEAPQASRHTHADTQSEENLDAEHAVHPDPEEEEEVPGKHGESPCTICESTATRLVFRSSTDETCCHTCYTGLWRDTVRVVRRAGPERIAALDTQEKILDYFRQAVLHEGRACALIGPGRNFKNKSLYSSTTPTRRRCPRCRTRDTIDRIPLLAHRLFLRAVATESKDGGKKAAKGKKQEPKVSVSSDASDSAAPEGSRKRVGAAMSMSQPRARRSLDETLLLTHEPPARARAHTDYASTGSSRSRPRSQPAGNEASRARARLKPGVDMDSSAHIHTTQPEDHYAPFASALEMQSKRTAASTLALPASFGGPQQMHQAVGHLVVAPVPRASMNTGMPAALPGHGSALLDESTAARMRAMSNSTATSVITDSALGSHGGTGLRGRMHAAGSSLTNDMSMSRTPASALPSVGPSPSASTGPPWMYAHTQPHPSSQMIPVPPFHEGVLIQPDMAARTPAFQQVSGGMPAAAPAMITGATPVMQVPGASAPPQPGTYGTAYAGYPTAFYSGYHMAQALPQGQPSMYAHQPAAYVVGPPHLQYGAGPPTQQAAMMVPFSMASSASAGPGMLPPHQQSFYPHGVAHLAQPPPSGTMQGQPVFYLPQAQSALGAQPPLPRVVAITQEQALAARPQHAPAGQWISVVRHLGVPSTSV